ncbi:MAG: molecular chaperone DnaJ [Chloroflexi bacterium RBG_19FT_COMBO_62_14]|nr:MAG: molecular chaperone DnaJ [Chloroflexi bacterium RBG_19FT_COMBO_62_14]
MAEKRDYYQVLELERSATSDDIRRAYRRLAKQYHPDANKADGAEEQFKEINEAYAVLSDEQRRSAYDRFGHAGLKGMPMDFDFGLSDIFEEFFGFSTGGRRNRRSPRRGADLRYDVTLEFERAVFGADTQIEFNRLEVCTSCKGLGAEPGTTPVRCQTCNGAGEVRQVRQTFLGSMVNVATCPTCGGRGETIHTPCRKCGGRGMERNAIQRVIPIPAGVDEGTQIRLPGEGEPGVNGGPQGDLYVVVHVKPHRYFRRRGDDILLDLSVNVAQATIGGEVTIPTMDGDEALTLPAGTQPGRVLRLKGKGVPRLRRNGRGDQLVIVSVDIPQTLTPEQRELFDRLAETMGTEARPQERGFLDRIRDLLGGLAD